MKIEGDLAMEEKKERKELVILYKNWLHEDNVESIALPRTLTGKDHLLRIKRFANNKSCGRNRESQFRNRIFWRLLNFRHTHTHTHTHIYIYIYIYRASQPMYLRMNTWSCLNKCEHFCSLVGGWNCLLCVLATVCLCMHNWADIWGLSVKWSNQCQNDCGVRQRFGIYADFNTYYSIWMGNFSKTGYAASMQTAENNLQPRCRTNWFICQWESIEWICLLSERSNNTDQIYWRICMKYWF